MDEQAFLNIKALGIEMGNKNQCVSSYKTSHNSHSENSTQGAGCFIGTSTVVLRDYFIVFQHEFEF